MTSRRPGPVRALAAGAALLLSLALTGCSDDDEAGDDAGTPTTTAASSDPATLPSDPSDPSDPSSAPTTEASSAPAEPTEPASSAPAEPSTVEAVAAAEDWVAALDELVDPTVSAKRRATHIKGGADLVSAIPQLDQAVAGVPLTFAIGSPVVAGNDGVGTVSLTSNGEDFGSVRDVTFARVDGTWRLTREGACRMAAVAGLTCP